MRSRIKLHPLFFVSFALMSAGALLRLLAPNKYETPFLGGINIKQLHANLKPLLKLTAFFVSLLIAMIGLLWVASEPLTQVMFGVAYTFDSIGDTSLLSTFFCKGDTPSFRLHLISTHTSSRFPKINPNDTHQVDILVPSSLSYPLDVPI